MTATVVDHPRSAPGHRPDQCPRCRCCDFIHDPCDACCGALAALRGKVKELREGLREAHGLSEQQRQELLVRGGLTSHADAYAMTSAVIENVVLKLDALGLTDTEGPQAQPVTAVDRPHSYGLPRLLAEDSRQREAEER